MIIYVLCKYTIYAHVWVWVWRFLSSQHVARHIVRSQRPEQSIHGGGWCHHFAAWQVEPAEGHMIIHDLFFWLNSCTSRVTLNLIWTMSVHTNDLDWFRRYLYCKHERSKHQVLHAIPTPDTHRAKNDLRLVELLKDESTKKPAVVVLRSLAEENEALAIFRWLTWTFWVLGIWQSVWHVFDSLLDKNGQD